MARTMTYLLLLKDKTTQDKKKEQKQSGVPLETQLAYLLALVLGSSRALAWVCSKADRSAEV